MNDIRIRIERISIKNFKNIENGEIKLSSDYSKYQANLLGLYGQNGSGKTALIDVLDMTNILMKSDALPLKYGEMVNKNAEFAHIAVEFSIKFIKKNVQFTFIYDYSIRKVITNPLEPNNSGTGGVSEWTQVFDEVLSYSCHSSGKTTRMTALIDTRTEQPFIPRSKYRLLVGKKKEIKTNLLVAKGMAANSGRSFIFSRELIKTTQEQCQDVLLKTIPWVLFLYSDTNFFVVSTRNTSYINSLDALPVFVGDENSLAGNVLLKMDEPGTISEVVYPFVEESFLNMNLVIEKMVPGLNIYLQKLGTQISEDGKNEIRYQLMSRRGDVTIPLLYESDGIKKIVSILHLLIGVYNNPSMTVAIDEIDSGIFEYLLGELLAIIQEKGKGQLIFTSHNLRPLETLDKKFIVFTTTDPKKRFVRLTNVKKNNNLRDFYYRDIILGGQMTPIYEPTNNQEIAMAFREAGITHVDA